MFQATNALVSLGSQILIRFPSASLAHTAPQNKAYGQEVNPKLMTQRLQYFEC